MFGPQQAIANPFGITVFGSSIARVPPDMASIRAVVSVHEGTNLRRRSPHRKRERVPSKSFSTDTRPRSLAPRESR
jgi:hypothetical protein